MDEGIASRGEWSVLWRLRGEIDQLEGNYPSAIENYQRSLDYGRTGQTATVRRLISLLYATNRIEDANEALKYLGETAAADPLRKIVSDIKEKTGNIDDALEMAKKDVEAATRESAKPSLVRTVSGASRSYRRRRSRISQSSRAGS